MRISDWSSDVCSSDLFFDQIANNLLHVTADIADFSELGRLHLYERRVGQLGQAARNFGLAAARGAYHQDVLGRHFVPKRVGQALPPPAVAQRHGDSPLGLLLTDRSEEHTSELQSLMRNSYAVFCLKTTTHPTHNIQQATRTAYTQHPHS